MHAAKLPALARILAIALLTVVGTPASSRAQVCTDDVKICPDGTAVARVPPLCTFAPCPVDHFQCYGVRRQSSDRVELSLDDDLGSSTVEVRRPRTLCAPASKNGEDPTAPAHPDHLVGYEIRREEPRFRKLRNVVVEDQFGTLVLDLRRPDQLLVPSAKSLIGPATPLGSPVVDHYRCYRVSGARRRVPEVTVETQFGNDMTLVKKPLRLCLPVDKEGEGILDASARLMCYEIKRTPSVKRTAWFDNQLAAGILDVTRATELCVPVRTGGVAPFRRVFVSSTQVTGGFGGLAAGDAICQSLADAVPLGGSWTAWLSDSATDAKDRITDAGYLRI